MNNKIKINLDELSVSEKIVYYNNLRKKCIKWKNNQPQFGQKLIKQCYPFLRKYKLSIEGEENIPRDTNVLFVANHGNSHDIFTGYEVMSKLNRDCSVMVATDCLSPITTKIFNISNATLLDRRVNAERKNSTLELSNKIINGKDGLIFGEATWNLNPFYPMHNIHNGAAKIALISQVPIIPTIFEYIEKNEMVSSDSQLFEKCIIRFGKPITVVVNDSLSHQSLNIKNEMSSIRRQVWKDFEVSRPDIFNIDIDMYLNHTYAKKFGAFGFTYDSKKEQEYLLFLKGESKENEYTIDENGNFVPGITEKKR